ncbi:MAG TPA: hypothetical protein VNO43_15750, partial [Candidatus Eisenbacteria bacterium]|nr:hypothetical protein [Candidatus Eisenbacteria bacterium]
LDRAKAFPRVSLSAELADRAIRLSRKNVHYYDELVSPLERIGRDDLARCIRRKLAQYHRGPGWKARMAKLRAKAAEFDEGYLNGNLKRVKHLLGLY